MSGDGALALHDESHRVVGQSVATDVELLHGAREDLVGNGEIVGMPDGRAETSESVEHDEPSLPTPRAVRPNEALPELPDLEPRAEPDSNPASFQRVAPPGLEPGHPLGRGILNPLRLPFRQGALQE